MPDASLAGDDDDDAEAAPAAPSEPAAGSRGEEFPTLMRLKMPLPGAEGEDKEEEEEGEEEQGSVWARSARRTMARDWAQMRASARVTCRGCSTTCRNDDEDDDVALASIVCE